MRSTSLLVAISDERIDIQRRFRYLFSWSGCGARANAALDLASGRYAKRFAAPLCVFSFGMIAPFQI